MAVAHSPEHDKLGAMKRKKSVKPPPHAAYLCHFQPEPEGGFTVTCPKLPPVVTYGETLEEAQERTTGAAGSCCHRCAGTRRFRDYPNKRIASFPATPSGSEPSDSRTRPSPRSARFGPSCGKRASLQRSFSISYREGGLNAIRLRFAKVREP